MKISSSVIVVTGANSGLGFALSEALTKHGASVVMSGRSKDRVESAAKRVGTTAILADVTIEADVTKLANETVKRFGKIRNFFMIPRNIKSSVRYQAFLKYCN